MAQQLPSVVGGGEIKGRQTLLVALHGCSTAARLLGFTSGSYIIPGGEQEKSFLRQERNHFREGNKWSGYLQQQENGRNLVPLFLTVFKVIIVHQCSYLVGKKEKSRSLPQVTQKDLQQTWVTTKALFFHRFEKIRGKRKKIVFPKQVREYLISKGSRIPVFSFQS